MVETQDDRRTQFVRMTGLKPQTIVKLPAGILSSCNSVKSISYGQLICGIKAWAYSDIAYCTYNKNFLFLAFQSKALLKINFYVVLKLDIISKYLLHLQRKLSLSCNSIRGISNDQLACGIKI